MSESLNKEQIIKLLPHREPMLLIDELNNISDNQQVMGYPALPLKEFVKQRKK